MTENRTALNCLVLLQSFEVYWAYYAMSDGKIYASACRQSAGAFARATLDMSLDSAGLVDPARLDIQENIDPHDLLEKLLAWADSKEIAPFGNMFQSIRSLSTLLHALKADLLKSVGAAAKPIMQVNREELMYREGVVRWQAHLPTMVVMGQDSPEDLLARASAETSIVVVGHIKGLRELTLFARDTRQMTGFVNRLIEHSRLLVDEYMGIFDKFTGDGFVAHFNKAICDVINLDFLTASSISSTTKSRLPKVCLPNGAKRCAICR
jgi:hypothetical protein